MMTSLSDGAIMTKIKAMYGKRLTEEQYRALMQKKTVAEVAAYLKDETGYSEALSAVQPGSIHRGQLENMLRKTRFNRYLSLMRYEFQKESFYDYVVKEVEIDQILQMIRLLNTRRPEEYILQYPAFIEKKAAFSFLSLANVRDFDGLLALLAKTPYANLLRQFRPVGAELIDYTRCEVALQSFYYTGLKEQIKKKFSKKTALQLNEIFDTYTELTNINNILRYKAYFPKTPYAEIRKSMLPTNDRIPKRFMDELIESPDIDKARDALVHSPYVKYTNGKDNIFIEYELNRIRYNLCRNYLRFSQSTATVFVSYMILSMVEIANITTIIEGIRYGVPHEEIKKMII
ncbi:MAG: V-type ATPase subunit [Oscillospiraceae bacterium]|jgi:V/A-type H+-transporting ATPase subunit C|nr:V-type ATPase subunit [Oscillospiraceae bacterium]